MRKPAFITAALTVLLLLVGFPTAQATSDGPLPYDVTTVGIQLPEGDQFSDGSHVNARFFDPSGVQRTVNVHMEAKCVDRTDAEYAECGLPPTGAPLMGAAVAAGLLVLTGAGLAVARRRSTR